MGGNVIFSAGLQAPIGLTPTVAALTLASDPQGVAGKASPVPNNAALNLVGQAVRLALGMSVPGAAISLGAPLPTAISGLVTPANPAVGPVALAGISPSLTVSSGSGANAPVLLYIDIISGSATNGEGGKGAYLTLYGINLGTQANMGTAAGAQVTIGGFPVANYRYLVPAKTNGIRPGFPSVFALCVQIGSAAVQGLIAGNTYAIGLTVNGVVSNSVDVRGNPFNFTIQPGHFYFIDPVNGNDSTGVVDDITHPFRFLQTTPTPNASTTPSFTGVWAQISATGGDSLIIRGNGAAISDQVGIDNRWCRFPNHFGGTTPTGALGTGYFHFTAYPGPINGNAPEDVFFLSPASGKGGIMGCSTAFSRAGANGTNFGAYVTISNMRWDGTGLQATSDSAPINLQSSADHWRVVNNDCQWNVTNTNGLAATIVGDGDPLRFVGNYCHNISGGSSGLQFHGVYVDSANTNAHNAEVDFNVIVNANTGQCIMFHKSSTTNPANDGFFNCFIHHNWCENSAKYAMKMDSWIGLMEWWNNVCVGSVREGFQFDPSGASAAGIVRFENNTLYNCYSFGSGSTLASIGNGGATAPGVLTANNNIIAFGPGTSGFAAGFVGFVGGMTFNGNLYFDYSGRLTAKYGSDAAGIYANPQFLNNATFPNFDARLAANSAAIGIAVAAAINPVNDLGMNPQPRAGQAKASVGAFA
jgi:hypothetical protein